MINLLDYENCEELLEKKLKEGIKAHELIYIDGLRGIGKTYQLVKLARKYNWVVVEPTKLGADALRKTLNYERIYCQTDNILRKQQVVVVDEGVNIEKLLTDMECDIITGFTNMKEYTDCNTRDILKNLKNYKSETSEIIKPRVVNLVSILNDEIIELIVKIIDARKDNNMGTYKNLIIALKDVVQLKDSEENKNKLINNPLDTKLLLKTMDISRNIMTNISDFKLPKLKSNKNDNVISLENIKEIIENATNQITTTILLSAGAKID